MVYTHHDALDFLTRLEEAAPATPSVPVMDAPTAHQAAWLLGEGHISARRMARALRATFEDIDATFQAHQIPYEIGL